jgi:hypothetical protein
LTRAWDATESLIHRYLASPPALAVADEQRPTSRVKVLLGKRDRLIDAQPAAPEDDDDRPQPPAVTVIGGFAHYRDDLFTVGGSAG